MKLRSIIRTTVIWLAIAAGLVLGYQQTLPPTGLPRDFQERFKTLAEADAGPDLNLMLSHIREMAKAPHQVGSDALREAQGYLKAQLTAMGYSYREEPYQLTIAETLALEDQRVASGRVPFHLTEEGIRSRSGIGDKPTLDLHNISVTLDAPGTDETILFMAHTDSVITGPGAFDDTVSVAAMLEALRLLKDRAPVRDLVFLFTDGEEQGLLGAAKYVESHPEMLPRVRLVVNLEARGNSGALLMFETTGNNLNMVKAYRDAAGNPVSMSIATAIYRTMQSDTDLTRFMMAGYPGINLAVIEGAEVYHTAADNYQGFDRRSAAHYLETVTGLAQAFATQPELQLEAGQNGVFFPLLPGRLVVLPESTAGLLAYAAAGLFLLALVLSLLRRLVKPGQLLAAVALQLIILAVSFGLSLLVVKLVLHMTGLSGYRTALGFRAGLPIALVTTALLAAGSLLLYRLLLRRPGGKASAMLGVLALPAVLAVATALLFPPASYLFSLPLIAGLVVFALDRWCLLGLAPGAAAFLTMLLFVPLAALIYTALSFTSAHFAVTVAMLALTMLLPMALPGADMKR